MDAAPIIEMLHAMDVEASNSLPVLCAEVKALYDSSKAHDKAGADDRYNFCVKLAALRTMFPDDNNKFGAYLKERGLDIDKDIQANAIAMGKEPEKLRALLDNTPNTSIRVLYRGFRTSAKTPSGGNRSAGVKRSAADHVVEGMAASGIGPTVKDVKEAAGVSTGVAEIAIAAHEARQNALTEAAKIEDIALSPSAQIRFDGKMRIFQKAYKDKLDTEYQTKFTAAVRKWADDHRIPTYLKEIEAVRKMLENRIKKGGVMPRKEYQLLLMCVHTDTARGRTDEQLNTAFHLLQKHELELCMDKKVESVKSIYDMPLTRDDVLRRKA